VEAPNLPAPGAGGSISFQNVGSNFGIDQDTYITALNDTLTENPDGSGSFTFTGASTVKTLSGSLNWTCS
jgi:hypothetical protein